VVFGNEPGYVARKFSNSRRQLYQDEGGRNLVEAAGVELFHILCFLLVADSRKGIKGIKGQSDKFIVRVSFTETARVSP